jgi:hypothetical protein
MKFPEFILLSVLLVVSFLMFSVGVVGMLDPTISPTMTNFLFLEVVMGLVGAVASSNYIFDGV